MSKRYPYLLYPLIFMFPPVHELGHVFIAWLFNVKVVKLEFALTTFENKGSALHWFFQGLWDFPIFQILFIISVVCMFLFVYYLLKDSGLDLKNIKCLKFNKHPKREEVRL